MWSSSSRCRKESIYLLWTWCLYTWSCLDNLITMRFSIDCSTVICSPTVILMLSWEKPLVKLMAPGSISYHICFQSTFICIFIFCIYIIKYQKYIYLIIISIRSHFRRWSWRDWQPLYRVGCKVLICLCRYVGLERGLLLDWYLGSQNRGKYLSYCAASPFPLQGKTNAVLKR